MTDDHQEPNNVVHVAFHVKESGWAPRPDEERSRCITCYQHTIIDEKERAVLCAHCGRQLDPFEVLNYHANRQEQQRRWLTYCRQQEAKAEQQLSDLKKQLTNIRARIKTASRKDAELAVELERKRQADLARFLDRNSQELMDLAKKFRNRVNKHYGRR